MASSTFRLFVDKENSVGHVGPSKGAVAAAAAKDFNRGRRALEDRKNLQSAQTNQVNLTNKATACKPGDSRPKKLLITGPPEVNGDTYCAPSAPTNGDDCEKETMHICPVEEDDYEDLWPKSERPSAVLTAACRLIPSELCDNISETSNDGHFFAADTSLLPIPFPQHNDSDSDHGSVDDLVLEPLQPVGEACIDDLLTEDDDDEQERSADAT